jgi:hypothetical protein
MTARQVGITDSTSTIQVAGVVLRTKTVKCEQAERCSRSQQWQNKVADEVARGAGWAHRITNEKEWVPIVFSLTSGSFDMVSQLEDQEALWHPLAGYSRRPSR